MKEKLILTNINKYCVRDADCENLVFEAKEFGIQEIVVGPSSIPGILRLLQNTRIGLGVTVAYPSGAYFGDAKTEEIRELAKIYDRIDNFYAVPSEGLFLSGYTTGLEKEIRAMKEAVGDKRLYVISEIGSMSSEQLNQFVQICRVSGVTGIVSSTGFHPYKASFPSAEKIRELKTAAGAISVIGFGMDGYEALASGADKIMVNEVQGYLDRD